MGYANGTTVSIGRSKMEIEKILQKYHATAFGTYQEDDRALVQFKIMGRSFQIGLPLLPLADFMETPTGRSRTERQALETQEKETRRRWRAVCLVLKAKLELIETGSSSVDAEFFPYLVLPDGETVQDKLMPHVESLISGKDLGKLLAPPK